jgi:hypothetical protein
MWAPVWTPGSTRQATRAELHALFTEPGPADVPDDQWKFHRPDIPRDSDGSRNTVDFVLLSGFRVPVAPEVRGRPLSQRAVARLGAALDRSPLGRQLSKLTGLEQAGIENFHAEGPENRSNVATLVWRIEPREPAPFETTARIEAPGHYGRSHVDLIELQLKVTSRLSAWNGIVRQIAMRARRALDVAEWAALLDSVLATLTSTDTLGPIADLAGVDPVTIRQPRVLHLTSGPPVTELLPQLPRVRGGGESHGAHLLADPALDLSSAPDRTEQVDLWLSQIGSDAGLLGLENLIDQMRGRAAS